MSSNQEAHKPNVWHYSWEEFDLHVKQLVRDIREREPKDPRTIISLGRGGATLGAALANVFGTRLYYWGLASYNAFNAQTSMTVYQGLSPVMEKEFFREGNHVLLVDDIHDSGETFKWAKGRFPTAGKVALVAKTREGYMQSLDYWAATTDPDVWVEFPWEKNYG
jgi:hypoxanthine phosphoribosyltransferase